MAEMNGVERLRERAREEYANTGLPWVMLTCSDCRDWYIYSGTAGGNDPAAIRKLNLLLELLDGCGLDGRSDPPAWLEAV